MSGLVRRDLPHYAQVVLWSLLAVALYLTSFKPYDLPRATTGATVTVLSALPAAVRYHPLALPGARIVFTIAAVLWAFRRAVPVSSWATALFYTVVVALELERRDYVDHCQHLVTQLLWTYAVAWHVSARAIRAADAKGRFWRTRLVPRWAFLVSLLQVGVFYTLAGVAKLVDGGGLAWANGVSLQLWVSVWGLPGSLWVRALLASRRLAQAFQLVTLVAETAAVFVLPFRRARALVGLALLSFHVGQHFVFGWRFEGNAVAIAMTLLPTRMLVRAAAARWRRRGRAR